MPLWSPIEERKETVGVFRKVLNMAFRPPDERSTRKLAEEAGLDRNRRETLLHRLRKSVRRSDK